MKDKLIKRLVDTYNVLKPLSEEAEKELKSINATNISSKMGIVSKFEHVKSLYNQFFLLAEIIQVDAQTPLTEASQEIADYYTSLIEMVNKMKDPKAMEEFNKLLNLKNG